MLGYVKSVFYTVKLFRKIYGNLFSDSEDTLSPGVRYVDDKRIFQALYIYLVSYNGSDICVVLYHAGKMVFYRLLRFAEYFDHLGSNNHGNLIAGIDLFEVRIYVCKISDLGFEYECTVPF